MKQKIYFLPLFLLLLTGCGSTYQVQKATSQSWMGGAAGSGGGVNYRVFIAKTGKDAVSIEKVWLGTAEQGWNTQFRVYADSSRQFLQDSKADADVNLFRIEFAELTPPPPNPRGHNVGPQLPPYDTPPADLPAEFKKGAVIYYVNGKGQSGQWVVQDFQRLEPIAYP